MTDGGDSAHSPRQRWTKAAGTTASFELSRWRRERAAVLSALLLPVLVATLISLALGGDLGDYHTTIGLVDDDRGVAGAAFRTEALGHPAVADVIDVQDLPSADAARAAVADGDVAAAILIPAGTTTAMDTGAATSITVVRDDDEEIAGDLAALVVDGFVIRATAVVATGSLPDAWPLVLQVTAPSGLRLDAATHYGPSIGLFFVLVSMGFAAARFVADRDRGLLERLQATGAPLTAVLAGRALASLAISGASLAILAVAMRLLFGRSWGPTLPVVLVILTVVVAFAGVGAVLAAVSRTAQQAQLLATGTAFLFALASGTLAPPGASTRPPLADLVPTTHALDAFAVLSTEGGGLSTISSSLVAMLLLGAGAWAAVYPLTRRSLA